MYVDPATVETVTEMPTPRTDAADAADAAEAVHRAPARDVAPTVPAELRVLAHDARSADDRDARRSLAVALLGRGWTSATAGAASGLGEPEVAALDRVHRPGSAASSVADDLVSARLAARAG